MARSLVTDEQLEREGLMTAAVRAAHTELRRGAAAGRAAGLVRLAGIPADDQWYTAPAAVLAAGVTS